MNNNQWDGSLTKVSSLGEISKLMPALPPKQEEPKPEKKMNSRETLKAAVEYSIANPNESQVKVAEMFGISTSALYNARHHHKMKLLKGAKKKPKATWKQASVSTSEKTVREASKDNVNHPAHYKAGGIETIDFIEAKGLTYNLGNVVKYITRAGVKNKATHIEDLEKAAWYLNREINNLKGGV
jgi:hypothetical protein